MYGDGLPTRYDFAVGLQEKGQKRQCRSGRVVAAAEREACLEGQPRAQDIGIRGPGPGHAQEIAPEQPERRPGRGRPPSARYRQDPSSHKQLALDAGKKAAATVTWREGTRGKMSSRFLALRVRPANIDLRRNAHKNGDELPVRRLICESAPNGLRCFLRSLSFDRGHAPPGPPRA